MDNKIYTPKVKIRSEGRIYEPGERIHGIPDAEMEYLIRMGFVKEVCVDPGIDAGKSISVTDFAVEDDEEERLEFFTEEQLKKLPSKAAIISYAESIGLPGLDEKLHKPELIDAVLAYIEEVEDDVF